MIHIGCGMDSRIQRVGTMGHVWYDVDFPEVISERRQYYHETADYHMIGADVRDSYWITQLPKVKHAVIVMEGVSMYLRPEELSALLCDIGHHFSHIHLIQIQKSHQ